MSPAAASKKNRQFNPYTFLVTIGEGRKIFVTGIVAKRFLGVHYATISAHPRHIQQSCLLDGIQLRRMNRVTRRGLESDGRYNLYQVKRIKLFSGYGITEIVVILLMVVCASFFVIASLSAVAGLLVCAVCSFVLSSHLNGWLRSPT
jgi:hypothetical protein